MEASNNHFNDAIFEHLSGIAGKDELFAKTFAKPNKNIADCCTYILNQVRKTGRQGFGDDEIFNMAIHYYDEDSIEVGKPLAAKVVVNRPLAAPVTKTVNATKSATQKNQNQTSLF